LSTDVLAVLDAAENITFLGEFKRSTTQLLRLCIAMDSLESTARSPTSARQGLTLGPDLQDVNRKPRPALCSVVVLRAPRKPEARKIVGGPTTLPQLLAVNRQLKSHI
jgi:hypothetical protein